MTIVRRMHKKSWAEIDGVDYKYHIFALIALFILSTLG